MSPRAGLEEYGKSRLHRDSLPRPSNPQQIATDTTLPRFTHGRMARPQTCRLWKVAKCRGSTSLLSTTRTSAAAQLGPELLISLNLPEGTDETHKKIQSEERCPDRLLNGAPVAQKSQALSLAPTCSIYITIFRNQKYSRQFSFGMTHSLPKGQMRFLTGKSTLTDREHSP